MEIPSKWIRTERALPLPAYAREAIDRLNVAGHVAYIVGGPVRDFLLDRKEIKDYDIATDADPDELCRIFPEAVTVGKAFGVIKVPVGEGLPMLDIATFRQDLEYEDHRHPEGVVFSGPVEDAQRRDFTVNGLFYDPKTQRALDCVGGLEDLKARVIRAIGDPMERFREDALRLLRAVRFTTTLGFALEPATAEAIRARAKLLSRVSGERVRDELAGILCGPRPHEAIPLLDELGLLSIALPEVAALKQSSERWARELRVLSWLVRVAPRRSVELAWAAVLQPAGAAALPVGHRLKMSRAEIDHIQWLIEEQPKFREVFQMREATLQRFIRHEGFENLLLLEKALTSAGDGNLAAYEFAQSRHEEMLRERTLGQGGEKLLTGADLIQLGLKPGPRFTEILRAVEDLVFEREITSKEQALEYVVKNFVS